MPIVLAMIYAYLWLADVHLPKQSLLQLTCGVILTASTTVSKEEPCHGSHAQVYVEFGSCFHVSDE